jgi:hypothetical protein
MSQEHVKNNYRKPLNIKIIASAFIITVMLFSGGLFTGYYVSESALSVFDSDIKDITNDIDSFQLQFLFFDVLGESATCPLLEDTMHKINKNSYEMGNMIEEYTSGKTILDVNEYNELKKKYSNLLIGYWLLSKKMQDACGLSANTIVYFFTGDYSDYNTQGFVLTYLKNKYRENLLIFALDADIDEPSINALKDYFEISVYPSLIINGELYEGLHTSEELEAILNMPN